MARRKIQETASRLIRVPGQTDKPAPRTNVQYFCPHGHDFSVLFVDDPEVKIPSVWDCRQHGCDSDRAGAPKSPAPKQPRSHWDRLLMRRSIEELEALLAERLALVKRMRDARISK
jgi:RNA polymerase-binding protein